MDRFFILWNELKATDEKSSIQDKENQMQNRMSESIQQVQNIINHDSSELIKAIAKHLNVIESTINKHVKYMILIPPYKAHVAKNVYCITPNMYSCI